MRTGQALGSAALGATLAPSTGLAASLMT